MLLADAAPQSATVIVAIIGAVGVVVTAVLSNWDKLFGSGDYLRAKVTGYKPTKNFETELRVYFEVSGMRKMLEAQQEQILQAERNKVLTSDPAKAKEFEKLAAAVKKEAIRLDDMIQALLPVYQKYYTLEEMQELNKFYSTDVMQAMLAKSPLVAQDMAPIQAQMLDDYFERVGKDMA